MHRLNGHKKIIPPNHREEWLDELRDERGLHPEHLFLEQDPLQTLKNQKTLIVDALCQWRPKHLKTISNLIPICRVKSNDFADVLHTWRKRILQVVTVEQIQNGKKGLKAEDV
uniref:Uncharacterized protein n=1 Tax=Pithovirus LCPAC304 TaxID=2506594 RepID=A0A481Z9Y4_9VIRU|nr:MAG: hypothetical protein LCPAC304_03030 [Pithovirus LCPAC304]